MTKTKSKAKTSKTIRKADETKPQAKKKGKTTAKKPSAKEKDEPAEAPEQVEIAKSGSLATAATEPGKAAEEPVAVSASAGETTSVTPSAAEESATASVTATTSDSRLPPIGTVLQKRDRKGNLRCECEVVEGGVRYGGTVYRSLSSAAVAAAKDLGLAAKAMNGWTFWGLAKTARPTADPLGVLQRAWERYQGTLEGLLEKAKAGEHREPVLTTLQRHARVLQNLHDEVA